MKEAKQIQKEQLAQKYDEMIENSKPKVERKPKVEDSKVDEIKPKVDERLAAPAERWGGF